MIDAKQFSASLPTLIIFHLLNIMHKVKSYAQNENQSEMNPCCEEMNLSIPQVVSCAEHDPHDHDCVSCMQDSFTSFDLDSIDGCGLESSEEKAIKESASVFQTGDSHCNSCKRTTGTSNPRKSTECTDCALPAVPKRRPSCIRIEALTRCYSSKANGTPDKASGRTPRRNRQRRPRKTRDTGKGFSDITENASQQRQLPPTLPRRQGTREMKLLPPMSSPMLPRRQETTEIIHN